MWLYALVAVFTGLFTVIALTKDLCPAHKLTVGEAIVDGVLTGAGWPLALPLMAVTGGLCPGDKP